LGYHCSTFSASSRDHRFLMPSSLTFKLGLLSCLYFSQGLPFGFLSQALPALLRHYGVDLEKIGLVSLVAIPWALKFLWAPYVDHYGSRRFGKRKSWILPMQLGFMVCLLLLGSLNPDSFNGSGFYMLMLLLFIANLVAATQDIATDGLAVSSLHPRERGLANGVQVGGYRVGMLFGGGVVLILLAHLGWFSTFAVLAAMILLVSIPVWLFQEDAGHAKEQHDRPANVIKLAVQFLRQPGMWAWVVVLVFYKTGDSFGSAMAKPLLIDIGLTLEQVGWISGGIGIGAGIVGALFGGWPTRIWI
jgi:PAT family beta-lactamase induction signal transducer AmpG